MDLWNVPLDTPNNHTATFLLLEEELSLSRLQRRRHLPDLLIDLAIFLLLETSRYLVEREGFPDLLYDPQNGS